MTKITSSDIVKRALIVALEKSLGVVTIACKSVGCSRQTFYEYYNTDQDFKSLVDELDNVAIDFAESQLHKQIKEGVPASTIFYLKTKGKKRGYIEKTQIENSGSMDIITNGGEDIERQIADLNKKIEKLERE